MLVGVLGGGFSNMIFMPPGAVVLELAVRNLPHIVDGENTIMDVLSICQLHHMILTAQWDVHKLPRGNMTPHLIGPTEMIYDLERLRGAVESGIALLEERPVG